MNAELNELEDLLNGKLEVSKNNVANDISSGPVTREKIEAYLERIDIYGPEKSKFE